MSTPQDRIDAAGATNTPKAGPLLGLAISVTLAGLNEYRLEWTRPEGEVAEGIVERAEYPEGPWKPLVSTLGTQHMDEPPAERSLFQVWFYRVVFPSVTLGPETLDHPINEMDPGDRAAIHAAWVARRHMARVGERAVLFSRPRRGTQCPECWDPIREARRKSSCNTCDGTGYVEGASAPIPMQVSFGKEEPVASRVQSGKLVGAQIAAWTSNFPRIKVGDFVVRMSDRSVFEVLQWQPTQHRSYVIRQNIITKLAERGSSAEGYASRV